MKPSSRFKSIVEASDADTEIIPILYGYLDGGKLPDPFTVKVRGGTGDRRPDGWFHPSSHPLMAHRQLYFYMVDPDGWQPEPFDYTIKMSALIGSMTHDVIETALIDLGYLIKPNGTCVACGRHQPTECREHGAADLKVRSRGHMDGVIGIGGELAGFEFKTAMPMALRNIRNNDVAAFKEKWPRYWAQVQEYLRMTGMTRYKVIFMAMGNPWDMREFTITPDLGFALTTERKYQEVREAVEHKQMPLPCCAPGSSMAKSCPATSCPIKRMS